MSEGITLVLSLVVGFAVGWFAHRRRPPAPAQGNRAITIGPRAKDITDPEVTISKGDVLFWVSKKKERVISIEFKDEIFENMRSVNGRFVVDCKGRRCYSDEVKASVPSDPAKKYKYWQILKDPNGGNPDEEDGWVIIDR